MRIGLLGAPINNENMGCVALTYSLIKCLEKIAKNNNLQFYYRLFDYSTDHRKVVLMSKNLDMDDSKFELLHIRGGSFYNLREFFRMIKHIQGNINVKKKLSECDLIIDLTQGDSFSDIYGKERFYEWTLTKQLVLKYGIPLILGPQTYGPFDDAKVRNTAKQVIEKSNLVIARDLASKEYLSTFCNKDVIVGTDLAFALPYTLFKEKVNNKVKVGINVSGLLCSQKNDGSKIKNIFKTDYDMYIRKLIDFLLSDKQYEIHLISHVGNEAVIGLPEIKGVIYHGEPSSPCEVKTLISSMDVFVGARMHATIAAFSSGVATIPVAYSKKFAGLFNSIGYDKIVDIRALDTDEAVVKTIEYIKNYEQLSNFNSMCMEFAMQKYKIMEDELTKVILDIANKIKLL